MRTRLGDGLATVRRSVGQLPQRLTGWYFDRVYVDAKRYGCYNQQPYLSEHTTAIDRSTAFDWTLYQVMLSDTARIAPYQHDIERTVPGRTVLEIGPGPTAVLTRLALDAGASKIISVEGSPWVAESATRRLRRAGAGPDRAKVIKKFSDDLDAVDTDGITHFDVLLLEAYHAIASQERVIETIATLRAHGFTFDQVISRGFTTHVAPARAPRAGAMTMIERLQMRWPAGVEAAAAAMRSRSSSLHGDVGVIESLRLADAQVWQDCDFERQDPARTTSELIFDVAELADYAGLLFWNEFWFHDGGVLDTLKTPTCWGVFYVPLPIDEAAGSGPLTLATEMIDPDQPSVVTLRASADERTSAPLQL